MTYICKSQLSYTEFITMLTVRELWEQLPKWLLLSLLFIHCCSWEEQSFSLMTEKDFIFTKWILAYEIVEVSSIICYSLQWLSKIFCLPTSSAAVSNLADKYSKASQKHGGIKGKKCQLFLMVRKLDQNVIYTLTISVNIYGLFQYFYNLIYSQYRISWHADW